MSSPVIQHCLQATWHTINKISAVFRCYFMYPEEFDCRFHFLSACWLSVRDFFLSRLHKFSMGFKSGLFPGQSIVLIFFVFKNLLTILDLWHGAPSCINVVHLWTTMCNCSFSCNISRYLAPFMVVPFGRKKSPAVPFDDIAPHIITLCGCFIVATVYRSSKRVPTGLRTCCLRVPNCWIVDSSEKNNFSPLLFTPISIFIRKYHSFSLHRSWFFCWFMRFETKFVHQTSTYSGAMNIRTFQMQR